MSRGLTCAALAAATALVLSGCASTAQAGEVAPAAAPAAAAPSTDVREGDEVCPGQVVVGRPVDLTAWTEIRELRDLGLPVCDVTWEFYDMPGEATGWASMHPNGDREVWIDAVDAAWEADHDPALSIRSTVRHEFAHTLIYAAGYFGDEDGETLRAVFTDPLWRDAGSEGHEAAAEAVAEILANMRGDDRRSYYVTDVSPASLEAAATFIE